ncbi:MAG: aldehyde dehydrogenase (NADP(+)) [Bacteroidales bacterium]|nr:aldehyde dehydrogenase (NADP(+)) [Bacteroidales bacterium]
MLLTGKNIIDNNFSSLGEETFRAYDPQTREYITPEYFEATTEEINKALGKASEDFEYFAGTSHFQRAELLESIADEIQKLGEILIERAMQETALSENRLQSEKSRTIKQLKLFATVLYETTWLDIRIDANDEGLDIISRKDIRQLHIPIGPVAVFTSGNFPLAFSVAGGDVASALAAGCPIIVKAHPSHPGTSELLAKAVLNALNKCNLPSGIFSMLHGASHKVGQELVKHPLLKAAAFTGSFAGGKALFDLAMQRKEPIPFYAEMGSINPVFFLPGAIHKNQDKIATDYVASFNLSVGQFCTNPGISFLFDNDDAISFINKICSQTQAAPSGAMLSTQIENHLKQQLEKVEKVTSCVLLAQGDAPDNYIAPALYKINADEFLNNELFHEEFFGPVSFLVMLSNEEELFRCINALKGQLTAAIQMEEEDQPLAKTVIEKLKFKVGRLIINNFPTGVEVCHAMHHGGPFPASTNPLFTSVGSASIKRFLRPLCYQNFPQALLPEELQNDNSHHIWRLVNGNFTQKSIKNEF